ncbi:hypothetical protein JI735_21110 [Paenibacillus sonchi]|uniref:Uncharacterized protein n=1 Tax=Paenibacillus sonchi TaxID=373687 RepID=A0A974P943_9BACL|nr:hypothetical protein [Paenibacillus sonchi]QQZ59181.1 hypothetical protein JI735_21110 [Paenibacillus sonchi]
MRKTNNYPLPPEYDELGNVIEGTFSFGQTKQPRRPSLDNAAVVDLSILLPWGLHVVPPAMPSGKRLTNRDCPINFPFST